MEIRRFRDEDAQAVSEVIRTTIRISNTKDYPVGTDLGDEYQIVVVHESAQPTYDGSNKVKTPEGWDYIPVIEAK